MKPPAQGGILLRPEVDEFIKGLKRADIVVGIPSFNNARTIGHVVRAVQAGLAKYFPAYISVVVNSDGGSTDGTSEIVRQTSIGDSARLFVSHRTGNYFQLATPYHGLPGKGSAFRTVFEVARRLDARTCAVVDSDLRSITPEWLELLIRPVLEDDIDYVAPLYHRHKYDGTITNSIVYPLTRALYGKRIRQPIGGDFGFSARVLEHFLAEDVWETDVARYGIDIWMTATALANGFKMAQSFLGAKLHDPKDPSADLEGMLLQVVDSAFSLMERYEDGWRNISGSEEVPLYGFIYDVGLEPVAVDASRMIERFCDGVGGLKEVWGIFLPEELLRQLVSTASRNAPAFHLPDELWTEVIYRFAAAWKHGVVNREHLLRSLLPLYFGRTASWVIESTNARASDIEGMIEALCLVYERQKPLLRELWDNPA